MWVAAHSGASVLPTADAAFPGKQHAGEGGRHRFNHAGVPTTQAGIVPRFGNS